MKKLLIPADLNKNNFDCLRFTLAAAVIYSHCFVIYHGSTEGEPMNLFSHRQVDLGAVAVSFFFVISGFLIVKSFEYSKSVYEYFVKRILRICPGFLVAFLLSVFVFGAMGTIDVAHKFGNWQLYLHNMHPAKLLVQLFTLEAPKGAHSFFTNPVHYRINSPLWTIQYEFICYVLVPLFAIASMMKRKWLAIVFFLLAYTAVILQAFNFITLNDDKERLVLLYPSELPRLLAFFFAGSCIYFYRNVIPRNRFLLWLSVTATVVTCWWVYRLNIVLPLAGTYLVFYFAYHPKIQLYDFAKKGDFSYGLYLYGWPVQQLITYFFFNNIGAHRMFFISLPIAFILAYLSWHIVERPFLKMKKKLQKATFIKPKVAVNV